jgi:glycosyltransferase involved in cell wall biosynthesis
MKIALSTIFWEYSDAFSAEILAKMGIIEYTRQNINLTKSFLNLTLFNVYRTYVKWAVNHADLLLPNSHEELAHLSNFAHIPSSGLSPKSEVAYYASDCEMPENTSAIDFLGAHQIPDNYILQVSRMHPRKNQYSLIKALFDQPQIPIVMIGKRFNKMYYEHLSKLASERGNVYLIEAVKHEEIAPFYQHARLHVLPSMGESCGLVSLESLNMGCQAVVPQNCPYDTYFRKHTTPCNALDIDDIKRAINHELNTKRNPDELKEYVHTNFNWAVTADQTYRAYQKHGFIH